MEITATGIKTILPSVITVLSMLVSGFFFFTDYLSTNYVSVRDYKNTQSAGILIGLSNQKNILENRLFFLQLCKATVTCPYKNSVAFEIEHTLRSLQDVRTKVENYQNSKLK